MECFVIAGIWTRRIGREVDDLEVDDLEVDDLEVDDLEA